MEQRDKQNVMRIMGKNRKQRNATYQEFFLNRLERQLQITIIP